MMLRLQAVVLLVLLVLQECTCSPGITLRVRLPNGGVKRVTAEAGDTLSSVLSKLEQPDAQGLARTAGGAQEPAESSLLELGVKHGDFLYAVQDADAAGAAAERRKAKAAQVRAAAAAKPASAWHPFPKLARPPKPSGTGRSWADIEAQTAQTYKLVPQKAGRIKKVSLDADGVSAFADRFYSAGCQQHRCGALFGTVDTAAGAITVQAVYDVPIGSGDSSSYDPSGLLTSSSSSETDAISDLQRAQQVAAALGLRQVGWCFTHSQRTHHLAGRDVATAAAVQVQAMRSSDSSSDSSSSSSSKTDSSSSGSKKEADAVNEGAFCATVAVVVDPSDGSAVTEAYGISDLGVQMSSDGVLATPLQQSDAAGDSVTTTEPVLDENKPTQQPGTLNFIVNMPIVEHKGLLRSAFPAENDVTPKAGKTSGKTGVARHRQTELALLRRHLFHKSAPGATSASRFLKRVSDFNLLMFLSRLLGHDEPLFLQLCACVQQQDSGHPAVEKCKAMLEAMCATHSPDEL
eukprot:17008-Heterococcus_DN1.PRE.1